MNIERQPVESSQIKSVGHDPEAKVLEVEFKGGSVYRYQGVAEDVFQSLVNAESVGRFFGQVIKPHVKQWPFERVRGTDKEISKAKEPLAAP